MSIWGQQAAQMWGEQQEDPRLLGQTEGDHARIFPTFTGASAASAGEVQVNGKVVRIWEFSQLETLAVPILRQRAMAIKDAIGNSCPPLPSAQRHDLIQWILHMQEKLTHRDVRVGREGANVPNSFKQDSMARPIHDSLQRGHPGEKAPFGPRSIRGPMPTRDNYGDLVQQKGQFAEVPAMGIQSMRDGGEGRRVLRPRDQMIAQGVSDVDQQGVQSMKPGSEGRRYLTCDDHIGAQKREQQKILDGEQQFEAYDPSTEFCGTSGSGQVRHGGEGMRHIGCKDNMAQIVGGFRETGLPGDMYDVGAPAYQEPYNAGNCRRKQIATPDFMVSVGVGDDPKVGEFGPSGCGARPVRTQMGSFNGAVQNFKGTDATYSRSWKKDPSRLQGTSLII